MSDAVFKYALPTLGSWPKAMSYEAWGSMNLVVPDQVTTHKNYAQGTADLDKPGYSLTIDEQDATTPLTEINTAVSEVYLGVIIGNKTEADLDALLAQVKNMGIDKVVDAYQSGYERFMSR